jgi:methionyl-tRNA formyltransferase
MMTNSHPLTTVFFGTPYFSVPILRSLAATTSVKAVVTQAPKPAGKGHLPRQSPVQHTAEELGLTVLTPHRLKDIREQLTALTLDVAVVAAYGKILPGWMLSWPRMGAINVHGSILPAYRGAAPISAAILAGDAETGITYMQMNEKMDEGDILEIHRLPILADDTTLSLSQRMAALAAETLPDFIDQLSTNQLTSQPQNHDQATYTKLLTKDDGFIDLDAPPDHLERLIRAYHPWPSAWGMLGTKRVKLLPGGMVQMEGKKAVPLADFLRGYPDFPLKTIPERQI